MAQPTVSTAEAMETARMCRAMAGVAAPLERVPVIFFRPFVGSPGFSSMSSELRESHSREHPAWRPGSGIDEPGMRVYGIFEDESCAMTPEPQTQVPSSIAFQNGDTGFQVKVHHVLSLSGDDDSRDMFFGTIDPKDATVAASGDAIDTIVPVDVSLSQGENSITLHAAMYMAVDEICMKMMGDETLGMVVGPELVAFVCHVSLLLTLPENGSEVANLYTRQAERARGRYGRGLSQLRPDDQFQPTLEKPPDKDLRYPHPLTLLNPQQLKTHKRAEDLVPGLPEFLAALQMHIRESGREPGWAWGIARHFISRVSDAMNLWLVNPRTYYDRLCHHAARLENHVDSLSATHNRQKCASGGQHERKRTLTADSDDEDCVRSHQRQKCAGGQHERKRPFWPDSDDEDRVGIRQRPR